MATPVAAWMLSSADFENGVRFPPDFMFRLSPEEWGTLSQFATTLQRSRRQDRSPLAFTEHGCLMLANVLRSGRAVEVSVLIVRAFVRMRSALAANAELALRVESRLTQFPEEPKRGIDFTAPWPKET